jgi:hypothetical protein
MYIGTSKLINHELVLRGCLVLILFAAGDITPAGDDNGPFPEVKSKFGSKTKSYSLNGESIEYCDKVQVVFDEGILHRRRDDICYDYYFLGRGRFSIVDPSGLEANWQGSFGDRRILEFTHAYICSGNLQENLMFDSSGWKNDKINRKEWQKLQFMTGAPERYFWVNLSGELGIWPEHDRFFPPVWMQLELTDGENIVIYIKPDINEQLNVVHTKLDFRQPYLVAGYRVETCLDITPITFDSTVLSARLNDYGKFEVGCDIFFPKGSDLRGMNLYLPTWFNVDSVFDAYGNDLPYIKKKDRNYLYISPRPAANEVPDQISIHYRGKFMKPQYQGYDLPAHLTSWFPHLLRRSLGYYTINYTLHKDVTLISPGRKINEQIDGDYKTVTYTTRGISYTSFAYGIYDTLSVSVAGIPFTLYVREENTRGLLGRDIPDWYQDGLTDAFEAFYDWFGPPLAKSIRVVDQPQFLAQSSPGLIHITMVGKIHRRYLLRIRAHEIAHQWWGHSVVPDNFRDLWLSEGLAEYTSALYTLRVSEDTADYREHMKDWRRDVVEEGRIGGHYSRGYKAGPITMGSNIFMSRSPGDYWALIYSKAAYMLEMLHFEIDGPDYRTDFFNNMLAEYRRTYFKKKATSIDFIKIAAQYIGKRRAGLFFNQWLFGWKIPDFTCRYAIKPDDRERPVVEISIEVSEVGANFETPYPVEIEFADGSRKLFRLDGIGQHKTHMLGPFPQEIKKVRFDPEKIILSRKTSVEKLQ